MRSKQIQFVIKSIVPILLLMIVIVVCEIRVVADGIYVGNPIFNEYAYTIYSDYAVLEEFKGEEQEEIVIPTTIWGRPVTTIGWKCFERRKEIVRVVIHEKIEVIDGFAFRGCGNLVEVVNGSNVKRINTQAFKACRNLKSVELGNHLEVIELGAFAMCESLEKMMTQENLLLIEDYAFSESGVKEFVFNTNVHVSSGAFKNAPWLSNQKEEFVVYGDGDLIWHNGSAKEVIIPEGIKVLILGCFDGTTATDIYLPKTVTKIEEYVFCECENVKVYIPESVVEMGNEKEDYSIVNSDAEITIITTQDSYAYQYAIDHDIPYEIVESW